MISVNHYECCFFQAKIKTENNNSCDGIFNVHGHSGNQDCDDNGFASVAAFNKVFKETYQETPSAYRKKKKETVDNQESMLENYILQ